ncbi:MAG: 23S rRNA (adenine(2503)-C(2))-methyltransferase RlmN [Candidatus Gygaella obscura]|nr:23S rRNA (adenine(2503)-C(2))-methyltransferase RlmN [Candidatus Gygaella obscura]
MNDIKQYSLNELKSVFKTMNLPSFAAVQVFDWVYKKRTEDFDKMSNLSKATRGLLKENFFCSYHKIVERIKSRDNTEKFLFKLDDSALIEIVVIPEKTRTTLCVSTQVGCKFNCKFCMSAIGGFNRNLTAAEIINQFLVVLDLIRPERITNIVFMGIGEPLDNYNNLTKAIDILQEPLGLGLSKRRLCVSTCGIIPNIERLAQGYPLIKLSVSLHSAFSDKRTQIMPVNKKYPLDRLIESLKSVARIQKFPVTFEYVLLDGFNDSKEDALELTRILDRLRSKVNLIVYNRSSLSFKASKEKAIKEFTLVLKNKGVVFTLRRSRGEDIDAACGQLRASWKR